MAKRPRYANGHATEPTVGERQGATTKPPNHQTTKPPSTFNLQPSTFNLQHLTFNLQPNHQTTFNLQTNHL
ncbi:MAG: hypothetical protein F6K65_30020 [Moorea sp. SIO3C2]|nr:hypothetical protein [Moorena sp. SIO3C2]